MHTPVLQKMLFLSIFHCLFLSFLVKFAECSLYEDNKLGSPRNQSIFTEHVNRKKAFDMELHGVILWASMGFFMPVGILVTRMSSARDCHQTRNKILFYVHVIFQVLSVFIATAGAVLSVRNFENAFNNNHQKIGLGLYGAVYLQVLIGFRRPNRGTGTRRSTWFVVHWILGTTISLVGILNVYTGLHAYHKKTSKSTTLWTLIFTAQVSFMSVFYLLQDKWKYIQKQGVISNGDALASSPTDHIESGKDALSLSEPCRKINALGTHFSRTNALNKLFQLT